MFNSSPQLVHTLGINNGNYSSDNGFAFRCLPKLSTVKTLIRPEVISKISDLAVDKVFLVNERDFQSCDKSLCDLLAEKSWQIYLRFSHTAEPLAKDSIPEHLIIEINGQSICANRPHDEWCRPFNLSPYCRFGPNVIRFLMSVRDYEYLLPTLFEVSIVKTLTAQTFIEKLMTKKVAKEVTKELIHSKLDTNLDDSVCVVMDAIEVSLI